MVLNIFFSYLYNVLLGIYLFIFSFKFLIERIKGKRHPAFLQRLGFFLPSLYLKEVIWIHAVSVGEVKAASPFVKLLREKFPSSFFCITTTTATGFDEVKRSIPNVDAVFYSPLDFSFTVKRFVKKLNPSLYFLVESDFWPHLLSALQKNKTKLVLINGKFSEKAASRWAYFPKIAKWCFAHFDCLCVQSEEYKHRFLKVIKDPQRLAITGNLKFDIFPQKPKDIPSLKKKSWITISCTHAGEEEILLRLLLNRSESIFLAPRHPERFEQVAKLLEERDISYIRWSHLSNYTDQKVILIDAMGHLPTCYSLSKVAIIGGSFVKHVGGHNVLEPGLYGCPSLFGPYTFAQRELVGHVLKVKAGLQKGIEELSKALHEMIENRNQFSRNAEELISHLRGSAKASWEEIERILEKRES